LLGRNFRLVWGGTASVSIADTVTEVAFPLIAVLTFSASPFTVAALIAAEQASWLFLGFIAGALVDRARKKVVLVCCTTARAMLVVTIPVAGLLGVLTLTQLFIVAFLVGLLGVFLSIGQSAILPAVVERDGLVSANSRLTATITAIDLSGKGAAGVLVQLVGAPLAVLADSVCSLLSAVLFSQVAEEEKDTSDSTRRRDLLKEIGEGVRLTLGNPIFRTLTGTGAVANFMVAAQYALVFNFLLNTLSVSPLAIGFVLTGASLGGLLGSLAVGKISSRWGSGRVWRLALLAGPLFGLLIPVASEGVGVALYIIGSFGLSAALAIVNINSFSARQAACPAHLVGRMASTSMFVTWGLIPLGALFGGLLGEVLGTRTALWIIAFGFLAPFAFAVISPLRRVSRLEDLPVAA
jgi:MFS family permease